MVESSSAPGLTPSGPFLIKRRRCCIIKRMIRRRNVPFKSQIQPPVVCDLGQVLEALSIGLPVSKIGDSDSEQ